LFYYFVGLLLVSFTNIYSTILHAFVMSVTVFSCVSILLSLFWSMQLIVLVLLLSLYWSIQLQSCQSVHN